MKPVNLLCVFVLCLCNACGGGGSGSSTISPVTQSVESQQEALRAFQALSANINCNSLLPGAPRGLYCLHCTQSEAEAQSNVIIGLMKASCLENTATGYLVDNTFGYNEGLLIKHIRELTDGGRKFFVTFFLGNGPAQRRFGITDIDGFGARIPPVEFRERIQNDVKLQKEYQALVKRIIPVLREAVSRGAVPTVTPMLEDNLSDNAYRAMRDLTLAVLPADLPVSIGRNICAPNCFVGNEEAIPAGVVPELHIAKGPITIRNGVISNDGFDYTSPAFPGNPGSEVTLDDMRVLRDEANNRNNSFVLWSNERQGVPPNINDVKFPLPAERTYFIPLAQEQQELIGFLRQGR